MLWICCIAAFCLLLDQLSKLFIDGFFLEPGQMLYTGLLEKPGDCRILIPDVLRIDYVLNKGAAFGILQNQRLFFLLTTLIVCVVGIFLLTKLPKKHWLLTVSSGLLLGGALGNMIDRVLIGQVRDFINVSLINTLIGYNFPVFNVADICVVVGVILLACYILFVHEKIYPSKVKHEDHQ